MVAVEVEIGKEDMEEVQTAMPAEVDHAEVVDMVADVEVVAAMKEAEVVVVAAMKEAEEEDKKKDSTAKASRPQLIKKFCLTLLISLSQYKFPLCLKYKFFYF